MSVKGGYRIIEKYNGSNCGLAERNYTTNSNDAVNPWFVTGFSDAESSFSVSCFKNDKLKIGWEFQPAFSESAIHWFLILDGPEVLTKIVILDGP